MRPSWAIVIFIAFLAITVGLGMTLLSIHRLRTESMNTFSQGFEIQWRVLQVRDNLRTIRYEIALAAKGDDRAGALKHIDILEVQLMGLMNLPWTDQFMKKSHYDVLAQLGTNQIALLRTLVEADQFKAGVDMTDRLLKKSEETSALVTSQHARAQMASGLESQSERYWLGAVFILLTLACVASLVVFFYNRREKETIFHKSVSSLHAHVINSRLTALRLFLESRPPQRSKRAIERHRQALAAVSELDAFYAKQRSIAFADKHLDILSRVIEPFGRRTHVLTSIDEDVEKCLLPAEQIRLALDELVENAEAAIAAMPYDRRIYITAERRFSWAALRSRISVAVIDNGCGMSAETRKKATQPLFSTRTGKHNGLGLSAVTQLVETLGGSLKIRSAPDAGTTVTVLLPYRTSVRLRRHRFPGFGGHRFLI